MIIKQLIVNEADISSKIVKDPARIKSLAISWKQDRTIPKQIKAEFGPILDPNKLSTEQLEKLAKTWSDMLEKKLERTNYGDLSRDMKFADWLTMLYTSGRADWEDISGEGTDALGAWHALSQRGLLKPVHQDLNKYRTLKNLQTAVLQNDAYRNELHRIKIAQNIATMKKDKKDLVLIDNDRFWVAIPFNYGACYIFNHTGHISNFCTGGSSGTELFPKYGTDGIIVMIADKTNIDDKNGKWQLHAKTNQLVNSKQEFGYSGDSEFVQRFPGLLKKIVKEIVKHSGEIKEMSKSIYPPNGYDIAKEVSLIRSKFPLSYNSKSETDDETDNDSDEQIPDLVPEYNPQFETVDEQYRQFLAPNFVNRINQVRTDLRALYIRKNTGDIKRTMARGVNQLFNTVLTDDPNWLTPGSVIIAGRIQQRR